MTRNDDVFDITYSYYVEKMFSTITARLDKLITLAITVSGLGIFSFMSEMVWIGVIIAVLSITQIIFKFSRASVIAEAQYRKYLRLSLEAPLLSDEQLRMKRIPIEEVDSNPWSLLQPAAYKRACIHLGLKDNSARLTFCQACCSWLAGDLPRSKNTIEHNEKTTD